MLTLASSEFRTKMGAEAAAALSAIPAPNRAQRTKCMGFNFKVRQGDLAPIPVPDILA